MDHQKLRMLVFEKTGIKVDTDDPIFALVALNEAVLSECVGKHVALLDAATERLQAQTAQLLEAGQQYRHLLQTLGEAGQTGNAAGIQEIMASEMRSAPMPSAPAPRAGWMQGGRLWRRIGSALLLIAALIVGALWASERQERRTAASNVPPHGASVQAAMPPVARQQ